MRAVVVCNQTLLPQGHSVSAAGVIYFGRPGHDHLFLPWAHIVQFTRSCAHGVRLSLTAGRRHLVIAAEALTEDHRVAAVRLQPRSPGHVRLTVTYPDGKITLVSVDVPRD